MSHDFSVVANFCIDTEERLQRLKDSFNSFYNSNIASWHINIRGSLKHDVEKFLKSKIKNELNIFFLESNRGWAFDTKEIISDIKSKLIFFWIEDHICLKNTKIINNIVKEIHKNNLDHVLYTFFHDGELVKILNAIPHHKGEFISYIEFNSSTYKKISKWYVNNKKIPNYLFSICSFISLKLFLKNLEITKTKKKYNKILPFNFERSFVESEILPFRAGFLNVELFVSIDDDHGQNGYSLISRGLYQKRKTKEEMDKIRNKKISIFKTDFIIRIKNFFKLN